MITIPAGEYIRGCNKRDDPACWTDERPARKIYLNEFQIDKYQVTNRRYRECFDVKACEAPWIGGACTWDEKNKDLDPVNCVDWNKALKYCQWRGKRLPSEAEWEKAARGTDQFIYPWGNEADYSCERAVIDAPSAGGLGCGTGSTLPVGSKPKGASPYGAMDMAGNLWEWVNDYYGFLYYPVSPETNPPGPESGDYKVARGGDFFTRTNDPAIRTTTRFQYPQESYSYAIGFRCAQ